MQHIYKTYILQLLQPFYSSLDLSATTRLSRYQKGKTNLDLPEQDTVGHTYIHT